MNVPNKFVNNLTDENIMKLEQLWQTSSNFRLRNRSHAILLSFQRVSIDEIAHICAVGRDAVSSWIKPVGSRRLRRTDRPPQKWQKTDIIEKKELRSGQK